MEAISSDYPQEKGKKIKENITKESLKRGDIPLFDCVYCVKNSSKVITGVLKQSLHKKYFQRFLEESNNN